MNRATSLILLLSALWLAACAPQNGQEANAQQTEAGEVAPIPPRANDEARPSPNAMVSQTIGTAVVTVSYGRPGVKGREVFGGLEPYGEVWRAGANEATVMSFSQNVKVNGQSLAAGTYALFAIPAEGDWTLIFNSEPNQWGAYRYSADNDVLRVPATPEAGPQMEWLSYSFENLSDTSATAVLHWAGTRVPFTIEVE